MVDRSVSETDARGLGQHKDASERGDNHVLALTRPCRQETPNNNIRVHSLATHLLDASSLYS